ncbi:small ribosomal subunit protein bS16m-like [Vipera latastei]
MSGWSFGGCTNRPFYQIIAAHNRHARDGKYLEQIGCYDPTAMVRRLWGSTLTASNTGLLTKLLDSPCARYFSYCICKCCSMHGMIFLKKFKNVLGLSGFSPLHPMTITDAERLRKKTAQEAEKAAGKGEGEEEDSEEKQEHQQN